MKHLTPALSEISHWSIEDYSVRAQYKNVSIAPIQAFFNGDINTAIRKLCADFWEFKELRFQDTTCRIFHPNRWHAKKIKEEELQVYCQQLKSVVRTLQAARFLHEAPIFQNSAWITHYVCESQNVGCCTRKAQCLSIIIDRTGLHDSSDILLVNTRQQIESDDNLSRRINWTLDRSIKNRTKLEKIFRGDCGKSTETIEDCEANIDAQQALLGPQVAISERLTDNKSHILTVEVEIEAQKEENKEGAFGTEEIEVMKVKFVRDIMDCESSF